jgi:hypothetical protein
VRTGAAFGDGQPKGAIGHVDVRETSGRLRCLRMWMHTDPENLGA